MNIKTTVFFLFCMNMANAQSSVETFYRGGFNNSATIELFDDGTFVKKANAMSCVVDGPSGKKTMIEEVHGAYTIKQNHLHFSPSYKMYKGYNDKELQRSNEYVREEGFFSFDYEIVEYKGVKLLFANKRLVENRNHDFRFDNQFIYLANKFNASSEPVYFELEFWRNAEIGKNGHIELEEDFKKYIPEEYKTYILKKGISGKVKQVEEVAFLNPDQESNPSWKKYRITLDVGKTDGVRPYMILYGLKDCNGVRCSIKVVDVLENECSGYVMNYAPQYNCSLEKEFSTLK